MPIKYLLPGALLCALFPATSVDAKELRSLQVTDTEVARALPVQVAVLQERLRPQFRYNYLDTSQVGVSAGNSLYNGGGISYGQAMGIGLAGGLIAGAIINGAKKSTAKRAVRDPYELISQAGCDLPLTDSHKAMVDNALRRADWHGPGGDSRPATAKEGPRYVFTLSTSLSSDFSAMMTTVEASAYTPDASGKAGRKATWEDTLVVVSDGLWLDVKSQDDIDRMVAAEKQRYTASGANALIEKVNAGGGNAPRGDRKRAELVAKQHAENMADARAEGWSDTSTAMRRAALWSENDCALMDKTLRSNLEHASAMIQALLQHSLPAAAEAGIAPDSPEAPSTTDMAISVGVPEGVTVPAPMRVIDPIRAGFYVSHLSMENINLGYRHMVLDD